MPKGDVYITDSQSGGVYKLGAGGGEIVEVLPPGTYTFPNGITRSDDGRLLVVALLANATGVPLDQTVRRVALSFLTPPAPAPPPRHPRASAQTPPPPAAR
jgi:sugar lactone lactonase YvrE